MNKKLYVVIGTMVILHNGNRYEQGAKIELTDEEYAQISLYVKLDEAEDEKRKQAEAEAEKAHLAEAEKARKEAEKANKNNKGEGKE
ncbi:hypothetical protein [Haemophilus paraphrohaemolyticus]|uniref:DUF7210 domain-containing protein n=1 Tax=Haemophilus paraphrohaemolyticus HK411 TaxID=1095743 RepID=I2NLR2_9PAST|nr:hypothetical protein [Haemophilus paraphrohaemolyticus]EIG26773.1 hypothetical protein HMPREF1054_1286 [Haemophilus paraphrohaemolyticus HK411]OOR93553.1 hypothetical protein B0184_09640 [Haemophilus paraphrohaemolyticus]STP01012.1 Uncharacterised protein [Haemophilus paraphrohaemolyticus]